MNALKTELDAVFPDLSSTLETHLASTGLAPDITAHVIRCFSENVRSGKLHRGLAVVYTGTQLAPSKPAPEQTKQLCILGWLLEMFQAYGIMVDDVMDGSTTRRGELCWYRRPEIGLMGINDACLLRSALFFLLKKHLRPHPAYATFLDLFLDAGLTSEIGQLCDMAASKERDVAKFSRERYDYLVKHKSSYYSIYLPIVLALEYWGLATEGNREQALEFAVALGEYFQVHDDYIDVFGDPAVTGKVGTDIQDNKCTWFIIEAWARGNDMQREELQATYGREEAHHVARVKEIYNQLQMEEVYWDYEQKQTTKIEQLVANTDEGDGLRREVLLMLFRGFKRGRYRREAAS